MNEATIYCNHCGTQNAAAAQFCRQCGVTLGAGTPAFAAPQNAMGGASVQWAPVSPLYGGFWIRFVAAFIDGLLIEVVVLPVSFLIGGMIGAAGMAVSMPHTGVRMVNLIIGTVLGTAASWLYEAGMESSERQATLGKMVVGVKVTGLDGNRISFARATGRHFAKIISGMIFFIGYIMAGFTERKQALHDMLAGTLVQKV
jgi:uncharacterized RDD family membrane protein YckC